MTLSTIDVARDNRDVVTVSLNRPDVGNAYNGQMLRELNSALDACHADADARALVIRGNGKHFQTGADLAWVLENRNAPEEEIRWASQASLDVARKLNELLIPTVAAVQGACFGGGTGILASCDVVVATANSQFGVTETKWGLTPAPILPQLLAKIGPRHVRRYALSSERFDADEGFRIGLIDILVSADGSLDASVEQVVTNMLVGAPEAVRATKQLALLLSDQIVDHVRTDTLARASYAQRTSGEAVEGLTSFLEKRPASWIR